MSPTNVYYFDTSYNAYNASSGSETTSPGFLGSSAYDVQTVNGISNWIISARFGPTDPDQPGAGTPATVGGAALPSYGDYYLYPAPPSCFQQGTPICTLVNGAESWKPVETLTPGDLVKTLLNGFKPVALVGYATTPKDLYQVNSVGLTGCHAVLVDELTDAQKIEVVKTIGKIHVTDKKYRLPASCDPRSTLLVNSAGSIVWHIALENDSETANYGIFAGTQNLLVESCSIKTLRETMVII